MISVFGNGDFPLQTVQSVKLPEVGWRLIERRQLPCVFLSLLLFSCGLSLSMGGWGGVGWGINVMCTVRRTSSCSVDGVGWGGEVGWGINVMCTVRRTSSCSVDGVGWGGEVGWGINVMCTARRTRWCLTRSWCYVLYFSKYFLTHSCCYALHFLKQLLTRSWCYALHFFK